MPGTKERIQSVRAMPTARSGVPSSLHAVDLRRAQPRPRSGHWASASLAACTQT